jgi:hypothetical protein
VRIGAHNGINGDFYNVGSKMVTANYEHRSKRVLVSGNNEIVLNALNLSSFIGKPYYLIMKTYNSSVNDCSLLSNYTTSLQTHFGVVGADTLVFSFGKLFADTNLKYFINMIVDADSNKTFGNTGDKAASLINIPADSASVNISAYGTF